jgi:hypothetical protein
VNFINPNCICEKIEIIPLKYPCLFHQDIEQNYNNKYIIIFSLIFLKFY